MVANAVKNTHLKTWINYISSAQRERSRQGWATKLAMQEREASYDQEVQASGMFTRPFNHTSTAMEGAHLYRDWFRSMSYCRKVLCFVTSRPSVDCNNQVPETKNEKKKPKTNKQMKTEKLWDYVGFEKNI